MTGPKKFIKYVTTTAAATTAAKSGMAMRLYFLFDIGFFDFFAVLGLIRGLLVRIGSSSGHPVRKRNIAVPSPPRPTRVKRTTDASLGGIAQFALLGARTVMDV
jgi:hypothetical protein